MTHRTTWFSRGFCALALMMAGPASAAQPSELQVLSIEFRQQSPSAALPAAPAPLVSVKTARSKRLQDQAPKVLQRKEPPSPGGTARDLAALSPTLPETLLLRTNLPVSPKMQILENPARIVIDLPLFRWKVPAAELQSYHGRIIRQLRYARHSETTSRIVLDLQRPAAAQWISRPDTREPTLRLTPSGAIAPSGANAPSEAPAPPAPPQASAPQVSAPQASASRASASQASASQASAPQPSSPSPMPTAAESGMESDRYPVPKTKPARGANASATPVTASAAAPAPPMSPPPAKAEKRIVVIDAGHGGQDPGAIGPTGTQEKTINLAFARSLKERLEATGRYKAVLTRDRDVFIPLRQRVNIARAAKGDLFVSLHSDSAPGAQARGLSLYSLSETASDAETAKLAARENKADIINGVDLSGAGKDITDILLDLTQRSTMAHSENLGRSLLGGIRQQGVITIQKPHRYAGFAVLKAPDIPSVLVELGFVSHPEEERLLQDAVHRGQIADGLVKGIDSYFAEVTTKP